MQIYFIAIIKYICVRLSSIVYIFINIWESLLFYFYSNSLNLKKFERERERDKKHVK